MDIEKAKCHHNLPCDCIVVDGVIYRGGHEEALREYGEKLERKEREFVDMENAWRRNLDTVRRGRDDDLRNVPDIHSYFSLSYAAYLVINRSLLQSMPIPWQQKFVKQLQELWRAFDHVEQPHYTVLTMIREPQLIQVAEECGECEGVGTKTYIDGDGIERPADEDCPFCDGMGTLNNDNVEHRYETWEEVGTKTDPIPHYNRGRTHVKRADELPAPTLD